MLVKCMKKVKRSVKKPKFASAFHGREQYEKVARTIRELPERGFMSKRDVALAFTRMFSKDNPGFIAHRFVDACTSEEK